MQEVSLFTNCSIINSLWVKVEANSRLSRKPAETRKGWKKKKGKKREKKKKKGSQNIAISSSQGTFNMQTQYWAETKQEKGDENREMQA